MPDLDPRAVPPRLDNLLEPFEVFEVFQKHQADPVKFDAATLAAQYDVEPELMESMLKYVSIPQIVYVDTEFYGVYDIKDVEEDQAASQAAAAAVAPKRKK